MSALTVTCLLAASAAPAPPEFDPGQVQAYFDMVVAVRNDTDLRPREALEKRLRWAAGRGVAGSPLATLVRLRAAQELHVVFGKAEEARTLYEPLAAATGTDLVTHHCRRIARRDLARMQLAAVGEALGAYYADRVRYPKRLEALVEADLLPKALLIDPWGEPLVYRSKPSHLFPDMPDQEYDLICQALGPSPAAPRENMERQRFLQRQIQITSVLRDAEGKLQVGLRYDPADGVHDPKALTVTPGSAIPELDLSALLVSPAGVVLAGPDFTLVLPRRSH